MRWWCHHLRLKPLQDFKGRIVATSNSASGEKLAKMKRKSSPGLATERDTVMVRNTTLTGAINLAVHFGVSKIVLLGIDQKERGRRPALASHTASVDARPKIAGRGSRVTCRRWLKT